MSSYIWIEIETRQLGKISLNYQKKQRNAAGVGLYMNISST